MITSTTDSVDGYRAIKYFPPVLTNQIRRRSGLDEMVASFAGELEEHFQADLLDLHQEALARLQRSAAGLGANALLGIRFDLAQLGAEGAMLMVTAAGTPVVLKSEQEYAEELANKKLIAEENEVANAERRALIEAEGPLAALSDPQLVKSAQYMRRIYGPEAAVDLINRKLAELGVSERLSLAELPPEIWQVADDRPK